MLLMEPVRPFNRAAVALYFNRLEVLFGCYIEPTDPVEFLVLGLRKIPRSRMEECSNTTVALEVESLPVRLLPSIRL